MHLNFKCSKCKCSEVLSHNEFPVQIFKVFIILSQIDAMGELAPDI